MNERRLIMRYLTGERDFRGVNLSGARLSGTDLSRADLSRADLSRADLSEANLSGTDLRKANLYRANLSGIDLREANLCEADLLLANLRWANLRGTDLREANLQGTDLRGIKSNMMTRLGGEWVRRPPLRPYLTTGEVIKWLILGVLGATMFVLPLLAQYDSLLSALHFVPNAVQRPVSVPSSLLDGLFVSRFVFLSIALPAGLSALLGLLMLLYSLAQFSTRLRFISPPACEWVSPSATALFVIGLGYWMATFSPILRHSAVPWFLVLAVNIVFWSGPIVGWLSMWRRSSNTWDYNRSRIPVSLLLLPLEFLTLHSYFATAPVTALAIIVFSLPLAILLQGLYEAFWGIKFVITGEYRDFYCIELRSALRQYWSE